MTSTATGELKSGRTSPSPGIECWIPEQNHKGIGLIILPGGGYGMLAEHEGKREKCGLWISDC